MLTGIVIENSLADVSILSRVSILKSWSDGDWKLHKIVIDEEGARNFGKYLADGAWFVHFWADNKEDIVVVFKDAVFDIKSSDRDTWEDAITHGVALGIPVEQLNFKID